MKLNTDHIQRIDDYLKAKGIRYWDIRLEMTDHLACKIEDYKGSCDFKSLFNQTLSELGWDKNLKWYQDKRLKSINAKIRRKYFKNFIELFTNLRYLSFVVVFSFAYYLVFNIFSSKTFGVISLMLFGLPVLYFTVHYAYMNLKFKKSGYLLYGYFYIIFSVLISNLFYQLPRPGGYIDVSLATQQSIVFFTTLFNVLFMVSGIFIYKETANQYRALQDKWMFG
ncbi:hypothetical protein [Winogradskyella sp.]|uniref:hypothetical protein n=1 Tax=Winogradskyella sp. TaxID=1883156 RepID=UPI003BA86955